MRELATQLVLALNWTVLGYVIALDTIMLLLVVAGGRRVAASRRWKGAEGHDEIFASPLTPAVSILVPAHDEEAGVLDTLSAALGQRYPALEVVLVDDGGYGMLAYDFTKDGHTPIGCDLEPPDFVALAQAFRVPAREVAVADLAQAVADGVASGLPGLLVVKASYTPPPNTSPRWYRAQQPG